MEQSGAKNSNIEEIHPQILTPVSAASVTGSMVLTPPDSHACERDGGLEPITLATRGSENNLLSPASLTPRGEDCRPPAADVIQLLVPEGL